jgi:hypothetical protein
MTSTPDTVVVPRTMLLAMREYIALDNNPKSNRILSSIAAALSASEPVAWGYPMSDGKSLAVVSLTKSGRCTTPLFTHPAPSVSPSVEEIARIIHPEAFYDDSHYGSLCVETARAKAQSIAALFEGGKK